MIFGRRACIAATGKAAEDSSHSRRVIQRGL
jgi:hypothetical protein